MLETRMIRVEPHRLWSSGMVAGPPGLHGASAAVAVVSDLKYASGPATTPHLGTGVESVLARVERRGEIPFCTWRHKCCHQCYKSESESAILRKELQNKPF